MKLYSSVFLGSVSIIVSGCIANSPPAMTPQISTLVTKNQVNLATTQIKEVAIDSQKPELKVGDISELKNDKTCDDVGEIIVYAETRSYWFIFVEINKIQVSLLISLLPSQKMIKISRQLWGKLL